MKHKIAFLTLWMILFFLTCFARSATAIIHQAAEQRPGDSTFTLSLKQADRITIHTTSIRLSIRKWSYPKAQLVVSADPLAWHDFLSVSMRSDSGGILVEMGPTQDESGNRGNIVSGNLQSVEAVLTIPDDHPFLLRSAFTNVGIGLDLEKAEINVINGELTAGSFHRLDLFAAFAKVHLHNIDQASVHLASSTIVAGNCGTLRLESSFSNITFTTVDQLTFNSSSDDYSIDGLGAASGHKFFGSMKIGKLRKNFSLFGSSADISFQEIAASADTMKIDDRFAKLHIPVKSLLNFAVSFEGRFTKVESDFHRNPTNGETGFGNEKFTAREGAGQGKVAEMDIHCDNCEVDFR
jgi:hypothetical protein